uniref:REJ domain-containing protein n=1 Tax=Aegilops tauschii subsp. strangulata TaxID=200361 RepID=A0A453GX85_AEGTS
PFSLISWLCCYLALSPFSLSSWVALAPSQSSQELDPPVSSSFHSIPFLGTSTLIPFDFPSCRSCQVSSSHYLFSPTSSPASRPNTSLLSQQLSLEV